MVVLGGRCIVYKARSVLLSLRLSIHSRPHCYSIARFSASDIEMDKIVWHRPVVHMTGKFKIAVHVNQFQ